MKRILVSLLKFILFLFGYRLVKFRWCYVYLIREKRSKKPLYVGKTCRCVDKRFKEHLSKRYTNPAVYKASKRNRLEIVVLKKTTEEKIYKEEQKYIDRYRDKYKMYNRT